MVGSALRGQAAGVATGRAVSVRRQWITRVRAAALSVPAPVATMAVIAPSTRKVYRQGSGSVVPSAWDAPASAAAVRAACGVSATRSHWTALAAR